MDDVGGTDLRKKKSGGIDTIKQRYGYLFVAPWVLGIVLFVVGPIFTFFYYSVSDLVVKPEGMQTTFVGLKYYHYVFFERPYYANMFISSLSSLVTSLPIIVALSMILAIVLNQKFRGRTLARAVFFLPVIIASGAVMEVLANFNMNQEITASVASAGTQQTAEYMKVINFTAILQGLNLPGQINNLLVSYLNNTFNLIWSCGVQILLFVAGLQTIPAQLYEAGKVEGITAWEQFWYITFPMMGRIVMLVIFYTMVDLFTEKGDLIASALGEMGVMQYSRSAAMLWPYFGAVGLLVGAIMLIFYQVCLKKWE